MNTPSTSSNQTAMLMLCLSLLGACSELDPWDDDDDDKPSFSGVFLDSPVKGISYSSNSHQGTTNTRGAFSYEEDEEISFSIGSIVLGSATGAAVISPLQLVIGADSLEHPSISNMLRLLQTLDKDGDSTNGIEIDSRAGTYAIENSLSIDFHRPVTEFENDPEVIDLIVASTNTNVLIDAETASSHFSQVMSDNRLEPLSANKMRYKVVRNIDPRNELPSANFASITADSYNYHDSFTLNDSFGFAHTIHLYYVKEPLDSDDPDTGGLPNTWSLYVEVDDAQQVGGSDEENPTAARFILHFASDGKLSSNALLVVNNWTPIYNVDDSARPLGPDNSSTTVNDPPSSSNFEIDITALKFGEVSETAPQ